jgi:muconolactone delta-isomerase
MKILAKSRTLAAAEAAFTPELLRDEAERAWQLQRTGALREIYYTAGGEAVLVLEAASIVAAKRILSSMPLARAKLIEFEIDGLLPYGGYERLLAKHPEAPQRHRAKSRT